MLNKISIVLTLRSSKVSGDDRDMTSISIQLNLDFLDFIYDMLKLQTKITKPICKSLTNIAI